MKRRYRGDPSQQMLIGALLSAGWVLCAVLLGITAADWLTGGDTINTLTHHAASALRAILRALTGAPH
jgi:hypothetical protein